MSGGFSNNHVLEVEDIHAGYNGREVLRGVSVSIPAGQCVGMIGPNGCGKSTLFRVMTGLLRPVQGVVRIGGRGIEGTSTDARIRAGLGYMEQTKNVFTHLTVEENLRLAGESLGGGFDVEGRIAHVAKAFPVLDESKDKRAGLLSGGQRQTLAMAMVLMRPTKVLLLDEPVAGLSPPAAEGLLRALAALGESEGFATIIVEHRLRMVEPHLNRVLVMREGRIVDDTMETGRMLDSQWLAGHYLNGKNA